MHLLKFSAALSLPLCALAAEVTPKFEAQTIDDKISIGYGLAIGDMDGDGKPDILLADAKEFVWYKNPTWEKRTFAKLPGPRDNVCLAAQDIDGDGRVEIAVGGNWNPGETSDEALSGSVHYLIRPKEDGALWTPVELPHEPTVHRMRWVERMRGEWMLVVLPLHGRGNKDGAGEKGAKVVSYHGTFHDGHSDWSAEGLRYETIDESMHLTHQMDVVASRLPICSFGSSDEIEGVDPITLMRYSQQNQPNLVIGGKEGISLCLPEETKEPWPKIILRDGKSSPIPLTPFQGVGEIRWMNDRDLVGIEPFHGNILATYHTTDEPMVYERDILDNQLAQGHGLATANFIGSKSWQIVAGWREPNAAGKFGIKIYWKAADGKWTNAWVDENKMACEDLKIADLNGDGKPDIIASGRSTKNVVIYRNRTETP